MGASPDIKNIFRRQRTAIDFRFIRFTLFSRRPESSIGRSRAMKCPRFSIRSSFVAFRVESATVRVSLFEKIRRATDVLERVDFDGKICDTRTRIDDPRVLRYGA